MDYIINNEPFFVGEVRSVSKNYVTVYVDRSDPAYNGNFLIQVSLDVERKDSVLHFSTGDEIVVYYDGNIIEGKIENVYAITLKTPASRRNEM